MAENAVEDTWDEVAEVFDDTFDEAVGTEDVTGEVAEDKEDDSTSTGVSNGTVDEVAGTEDVPVDVSKDVPEDFEVFSPVVVLAVVFASFTVSDLRVAVPVL